LYYTDSRTREAISVNDVNGDGSLLYDSSTGVITYTGPSDSEVRAHFSSGSGVNITNGQIAIGQSVGTGDSVIFNQVTSNLVGNVTGTVSDISNHTTDSLSEGSTNLYYTDSRTRKAISVNDVNGDGSLLYDSSTGVITYTGPSDSEVRAHFSSGSGVTITNGQIAIGQSVGTGDSVIFNQVTSNLVGNVTGTVSDISNHTTDSLSEGSTNLYYTDSRTRKAISVNDVNGDGSLLYDSSSGVITYTGPSDSEVRSHFSDSTGVTITNGEIAIGQDVSTISSVQFYQVTADLIGNVTGTVSNISNHTTDSLNEGSNNLYYTDSRTREAISVNDVNGDGSLLYDSSTGVITYTGPSDSEVRSHFSDSTGVTITNGEIAIGQDVSTTSSVQFYQVTADNVGIGTTNPGEKLDVNGNVNISGSLNVNSLTIDGTEINSNTQVQKIGAGGGLPDGFKNETLNNTFGTEPELGESGYIYC
jgi:hypothetical protein